MCDHCLSIIHEMTKYLSGFKHGFFFFYQASQGSDNRAHLTAERAVLSNVLHGNPLTHNQHCLFHIRCPLMDALKFFHYYFSNVLCNYTLEMTHKKYQSFSFRGIRVFLKLTE